MSARTTAIAEILAALIYEIEMDHVSDASDGEKQADRIAAVRRLSAVGITPDEVVAAFDDWVNDVTHEVLPPFLREDPPLIESALRERSLWGDAAEIVSRH
ncbi:MAG: hypothetical protein QOD39_1360 [Mycobacterium sp.]|jgi:hypothetical protein|nr:hypothetical protein [Mycobacterium sp.]MDX6278273.1 hypothetical protein [Nocardioidaceae bacterium]